MEIQGPFTLSLIDNSDNGLREIHLGFTPDFQQLGLTERVEAVKSHLSDLHQAIEAEIDAASQQGMMSISQIIGQLLPHLESDEISLDQTIIIETGPSQASPFDDLLRSATL